MNKTKQNKTKHQQRERTNARHLQQFKDTKPTTSSHTLTVKMKYEDWYNLCTRLKITWYNFCTELKEAYNLCTELTSNVLASI